MTELYLISGFLGAGKTTLLQKLLREGFAGQKVALVENDFGAVSLDAKLLKSGGYTRPGLRARGKFSRQFCVGARLAFAAGTAGCGAD